MYLTIQLIDNFLAKFEIMENCDVVFYNVSSGLAAMDQLRDIIDPSLNDKPEVTFKEIPILADAFERYRWPTTMALQGNWIKISWVKVEIWIIPPKNSDYYIDLQMLWLFIRCLCNILPPAIHWCNCTLKVHFDHVQCIWTLFDYLLVAYSICIFDSRSSIRRFLY